MNNVFLDELPTFWNGYQVNTWFQIGIQIQQIQEDEELSQSEQVELIVQLLFGNEDGSVREFPPTSEELLECLNWFFNGWYHDNPVKPDSRKKLMDFDVDQWRIYADFMQIYHIDLSESDMHWWMFCGLLWNMPSRLSSFMQVLEIRQKKPTRGASIEEKKAVENGHKLYDLKQKVAKKEYTPEEIKAIDEYDRWMAEQKAKQHINEEALKEFNKLR